MTQTMEKKMGKFKERPTNQSHHNIDCLQFTAVILRYSLRVQLIAQENDTKLQQTFVPPKTAHQWIMSLSLSVAVAVNDKHHQLKPNNRTDDYDYDDDDLGM